MKRFEIKRLSAKKRQMRRHHLVRFILPVGVLFRSIFFRFAVGPGSFLRRQTGSVLVQGPFFRFFLVCSRIWFVFLDSYIFVRVGFWFLGLCNFLFRFVFCFDSFFVSVRFSILFVCFLWVAGGRVLFLFAFVEARFLFRSFFWVWFLFRVVVCFDRFFSFWLCLDWVDWGPGFRFGLGLFGFVIFVCSGSVCLWAQFLFCLGPLFGSIRLFLRSGVSFPSVFFVCSILCDGWIFV